MLLDQWAQFATIASPIMSAAVALLVLRLTMKVQLENQRLTLNIKRSDVLNNFHRRFGEIAELRLRSEMKSYPEFYYGQYWSLQKDQFETWDSGLVSNEQFRFWMDSRCIDWRQNESLGGSDYRKSYDQELSKWAESGFKLFMDEVHRYGATNAISHHEQRGPKKRETYREPSSFNSLLFLFGRERKKG